MMRLLFFLALAVFGLLAARRWTLKASNGRRSIPHRNDQLATVICATCKTEYRPSATGWQCPKCQR